jgi:hypothetical protein
MKKSSLPQMQPALPWYSPGIGTSDINPQSAV